MTGIVVGVDGSPRSRAALVWALAEARLRATPLTVIQAWSISPFIGVTPLAAAALPQDDLAQATRDELNAMVDEALGGEDPGIEVHRCVAEGSPAHVLLQAATGAELLVVGTRGRGGFAGLLLGSVSQQCAHHAPCPLVIVPTG